MRAVVIALAACGATRSPSPSPSPSRLADVAVVPDAGVADAPPSPPPDVVSYARQVYSYNGTPYRSTYRLTRAGDYVELETVSEKLGPDVRLSFDDREPSEGMWIEARRDLYVGDSHAIDGGIRIELMHQHRDRYGSLGVFRNFECRESPIDVRAFQAQIRPTRPETRNGCDTTPSRWVPAQTQRVTAWTCGPMRVHVDDQPLVFTDDRRIEWIMDWAECGISAWGYRFAAPVMP